MKVIRITTLVAAMSCMTVACSGATKVTRTEADSTEGSDLSGYWNDRDAQLVTKTMVKEITENAWVENFMQANPGKKPVIKLMGIQKRTDDRNVNHMYFAKQLERYLLNSGKVRVVAAYGQDNVNLIERERQSKHASDETAKSHQMETGADFTLQTIINSQNETDGRGQSVRAYLVNMELVSVETNEKAWIGEKIIRKVVDQPSASW